MADVAARLEAVLARLEAVANKIGGGGGAGGADEKEEHPSVVAFREYLAGSVDPFVANCAKSADAKKVGELTDKAWKHQLVLLQAASESKKPDQKELMTFLTPISDVITAAGKLGNANWDKAFGEYILAASWMVQTGTKTFIVGQLEAADFWLSKILVAAKAKPDADKAADQALVKGCKEMLTNLGDFCNKFFKTGLEWNNRTGKPLSEWKAGGAPSAPSAPAAPPAPTAPPAPAAPPAGSPAPAAEAGGMGAVFSQISKGSAITSGLKKVDKSQMTHKNPELRAQGPLAAKAVEKKEPAFAAVAKKEVKKEAKLYESKGTWFVENFDGQNCEVDKAELNNAVYILKPRNCTIVVKGKVKSIQIDGGFKCNIIFDAVLALVEVFNSQRVMVRCEKAVPAFAIDKTQGCQIQMSEEAMKVTPDIVTSSVSEINFYIPGPTPDADPVELPLPEQYTTRYIGGKLVTEPVSHGGG